MTTKICPSCNLEKDVSGFSKNKSKTDGLQRVCKSCKKEEDRKWYLENKEKRDEYNKAYYEKTKKWINEYKLQKGCQMCGYVEYAECLDFHHESDNKEFGIAEARKCSIDTVKKEVEKCSVLCAICHRKVHYNLD